MPTYPIKIRVTKTSRCPEGFYAIVNGTRIRFARRIDAHRAIVEILRLQRFQVISVREYARRIKIPPQYRNLNPIVYTPPIKCENPTSPASPATP